MVKNLVCLVERRYIYILQSYLEVESFNDVVSEKQAKERRGNNMINIKCAFQRLPFVASKKTATSETTKNKSLSTFNIKFNIKLKFSHFIIIILAISSPELVPLLIHTNLLSSPLGTG